MSISTFFNTYAGMYLAQSFCHSVVVAVIVDQAMNAWKIEDPEARQRFRLIAILFPIVSFPLYQVLNPERSSTLFRLGSVFDVNRWLNMEILGLIPVGLLFLILIGFTALVFFFQEMVPIIHHMLETRQPEHEGEPLETGPFLEQASKALSIQTPEVILIDDDEPHVFSTTGKDPVIFVSTAITNALNSRQLDAALAHELAHIARSKRPLLIATFILRIIMFFNPVVLIKFRRAVRDEEKICDDIAVSLTHNPAALAEVLKTLYHKPARLTGPAPAKAGLPDISLEDYGHNLQLESRIKRLEAGPADTRDSGTVPYILVLLITTVLNYFIV
jgi:hypothetical protein